MASTQKRAAARREKKPALYLVEFDTTAGILHACEKTHAAGYTKFDTHTPFPVHGMDAAMGLSDSKLGLIVFPIGLTGTACAFLMMWWMNGVDYPIVVGGKPPFSIPSMIPIMFELTVLFSAFATVFGMFHLNKIPRHHHPIFTSDRFAGFSDDKFFLSIEAEDPKFDVEKTKKFVQNLHPTYVELVYDDDKTAEEIPLAAEAH
jgi:hypothetical protein